MQQNTPQRRLRPTISPDSSPFWEACAVGRLDLPVCGDCNRAHLPPGPVCPFCFSDEVVWKQASGLGTVASTVVFHKAFSPSFATDAPYAVILVSLDEGPRLHASMRSENRMAPAIDSRVRVAFITLEDGTTIPVFEPVGKV